MKKLLVCFIAFFCFIFAIAGNSSPDQDEINATIEQLLSNAETAINEVDFDEALDQLNTALELSKSIKHQRYVALSSSILAQLYYVRHDLDKAATELQRAVAIQRTIDDQIGLAYSYVNYAKIFTNQRNYERATDYLNLSEEIYKSMDNSEGLGIVSLNRGILALNTEAKYEKAMNLLDEAQLLLQDGDNEYEKTRLYFYRGRTQIALQNYGEAIKEAEKGLENSRKNGFASLEMANAKLLSNAYEITEDYEKSLAYLHASNSVRDSIYDINREALATDATARYGMDSMRNSLNELSKLNAEQERSLKVNKLTTILSVALITILSLLTLSLYKNNNLRARANDLLQKKNSELVTAKENAEKASMAKAQFLSTVTHELRTPLYAVTGLTHLLLEESPNENQKEHLNSLKFSGEYLLSLINNILDLNKLEAKKVEMMETSFNLKKRISNVMVALKNSAEDKNSKLHLELDDNIPEKLKGDPLKISQILINLIGNAIKFTEDGDIWVRINQVSHQENKIRLKFEIQDNGEGISKEKQNAIFENFTQGSLQINRKFGGTGLGLSIVKNLLNLMNSEIYLESEPGKGSLFVFELDFETMESAVSGEETSEPTELKSYSHAIIHQKRILVVEDNKINQMITRKILEKHKAICEVADTGSIAIDKLQSEKFDLILMDIHMPGISGIEATQKIRKFNSDIPIIALTAVTLDENLDEFYLNGFNDIIPKPYKTEEFFHKINKHLSRENAPA